MKTQLKDIQNQTDNRGIDIQKVGVKNVEVPLIIQRKNNTEQTVSAKARISVDLPQNYKGTHMSRFIEVLTDWGQRNLLGVDIKGCLLDVLEKLKAQSAELRFDFKYFIDKKAPVSGLSSPMGYECSFEGYYENKGIYKFILGVEVPITTLCPCSKEISEYGAHNQRAVVKARISYDEESIIWLEDLISMIESCASSPVYPLLKREDEKFVTELAYKNPKFVEDVLRDIVLKLRGHEKVNWFEIDCESFESIHNHSAWAYQQEIVKYTDYKK
ncbi:MAG: GTP cyclohydrolase FolE2 [Candidatus Gastranaerophilaceae bacterium]|jgi:GTP cyclohydrolase I